MSKIVPWKTPFSGIQFPSIGMYVEHGELAGDLITAIVAPYGIDSYPKYLVSFGAVYEIKLYEEGCSPERGYETLLGEVKGNSACKWLESPSINSYQALSDVVNLNHFILLGGDNILEVVTKNEPEITKVLKSTTINIPINV